MHAYMNPNPSMEKGENKKKNQRAKQRISGEREFVCGDTAWTGIWRQWNQVGHEYLLTPYVLGMVSEAQRYTLRQPPFRKESSAGTSS